MKKHKIFFAIIGVVLLFLMQPSKVDIVLLETGAHKAYRSIFENNNNQKGKK